MLIIDWLIKILVWIKVGQLLFPDSNFEWLMYIRFLFYICKTGNSAGLIETINCFCLCFHTIFSRCILRAYYLLNKQDLCTGKLLRNRHLLLCRRTSLLSMFLIFSYEALIFNLLCLNVKYYRHWFLCIVWGGGHNNI